MSIQCNKRKTRSETLQYPFLPSKLPQRMLIPRIKLILRRLDEIRSIPLRLIRNLPLAISLTLSLNNTIAIPTVVPTPARYRVLISVILPFGVVGRIRVEFVSES